MTEYCSICGSELTEDEISEGICRNCQASMIEGDIV